MQEERSQVDREEALEEEVSEVENDAQYNPEEEDSDTDEEEDPAEVVGSLRSKTGNFSWMSFQPEINRGWKEGKNYKRRPFLEEHGNSMVEPLI